MVLFSARATWLAAALSLFASVAAHAAISDCEEIKQASIKEQLDRCVAHAACNFVLASKPDCAEGGRFLERTKGNALSQLTGLFNRNKALSANDVYEANLPEVDHPQDWKDRFAAIRDKVAQSGTEALSGKLADGTTWLYQGDVQDGKQHGWGVLFWAGGGMHRGEFAQDWRTGPGEYAAPNGYRAVGRYVNNVLDGEAWERLRDGARRSGNFANGKLEGAGNLLFPDGDSYTGDFVANGFHGRGTYRWAAGSSFEGNFINGKMDGQGTYTSTSGERSPRTYNAGTLVASAAPAAASVSPTAACETSYMTCSAICVAGGLAALLSRSRYDTTVCTDSCKSSQQQCLAALAPAPVATSPAAPVLASTSGALRASFLGGTAGLPIMVPLSPPGNATSRNECVKLAWLTSPLVETYNYNKSASGVLGRPEYFGSDSRGDRTEQRHLVATTTCSEDLVFTVFSCVEHTMLSAGNAPIPESRKGDKYFWTAGEHSATGFTGYAGVNFSISDPNSRDFIILHVARELLIEPKTIDGVRRRVVKVFYGAWPRSEITNVKSNGPYSSVNLHSGYEGYASARTRELTASGMSLARKSDAVNLKANAVLGRDKAAHIRKDYNSVFTADGGGAQDTQGFKRPSPEWRKWGVKTCAAFTAEEVWNGTQ